MRTIIAGSRSITDLSVVKTAIAASGLPISEVVSGTARGVDQLGESWASEHAVPVRRFPADWGRFGRSAGYRRNSQMADYADALVAIWDGVSKGTGHMIDLARAKGLQIYIYQP